MYIPRMLEDMLKLTVDVLFPKSGLRRKKYNTTNKKDSPSKTTSSPNVKKTAPKF